MDDLSFYAYVHFENLSYSNYLDGSLIGIWVYRLIRCYIVFSYSILGVSRISFNNTLKNHCRNPEVSYS